jgi:hypothetical protein
MDKETYNRAVAISNRLSQLQKVKEELENTHKHYLTYVRKVNSFGECDTLCADWKMKYIGVILDKHDKMIRQEIDGEIAALNKEIEEL